MAASAIPSNILACFNALAEDSKRRQNRRVRPDKITRMIRRTGGRALIGLVGVQSNQFPRAVDLARPFLHIGLQGA